MITILWEWAFTYRSARRDGYGRLASFRKFVREVLAGWRIDLGLHPKYDRQGRER